jgi:hypothetical protein
MTAARVCKVDMGLGLVIGWALVCTMSGVDYIDTQGDHVPEFAMLEATTDFMLNSRVALLSHQGKAIGRIVHSFPMTAEIADAMGVKTTKTGWMVAMKPNDPGILADYLSGRLRGFSIGGTIIEETDYAQAA